MNIYVFGTNLDSVLNDVGMLLACGVLKKVTWETVAARFLRSSTAATIEVEPASIMPIDSKAYDSD